MNCLWEQGLPSTFYNPGVEPMDDRSSEEEVLCSVECMFVGFFFGISLFFKEFFLMWTVLKVFINSLQYCSALCFFVFCFDLQGM